jgi:hypothetical protein
MTTYFCDGLKEVTVVNGRRALADDRPDAVQHGGNGELTIALPV